MVPIESVTHKVGLGNIKGLKFKRFWKDQSDGKMNKGLERFFHD